MWQFVSNAITFIFIYFLSVLIARYMRAFKPTPKLIFFKSSPAFNFVTFPISLISKKNKKKIVKKDLNLCYSELLFLIINHITLVGAIILQFVPPMPCDVIEVEFGVHYRGLDFIVDTYNQKIPLCLIFSLVLAELLIMFGEVLIRAVLDSELRKKLGIKLIIGIIALCVLFATMLIYFGYLLFT